MIDDPENYRVNLICSCQQDVAYGYGPDAKTARSVAERAFRQHHGSRAEFTQVLIERASEDGTHYEEDTVALHVDLPEGLARLIIHSHGLVMFQTVTRSKRGYSFESSDLGVIRAFWIALNEVREHPPRGQGGLSISHAARVKLAKLKRVVKHLWPEAIVENP